MLCDKNELDDQGESIQDNGKTSTVMQGRDIAIEKGTGK